MGCAQRLLKPQQGSKEVRTRIWWPPHSVPDGRQVNGGFGSPSSRPRIRKDPNPHEQLSEPSTTRAYPSPHLARPRGRRCGNEVNFRGRLAPGAHRLTCGLARSTRAKMPEMTRTSVPSNEVVTNASRMGRRDCRVDSEQERGLRASYTFADGLRRPATLAGLVARCSSPVSRARVRLFCSDV